MPNREIREVCFDPLSEPVCLSLNLETDYPSTYQITSHDCSGTFQGTLMIGNNISGPTDIITLPINSSALDQQHIGWHFTIAAPSERKKVTYSIEINLSQGHQLLTPEPIHISGHHKIEKVVIGFIKLVAHQSLSSDNNQQFLAGNSV
ncbi:hypothetical protein [Sneathiella sp.]|jgi:hypothetical protein|uniref:hypothetical protein n=1 Tax=Sneathiella sp. TaxID=1964365 RepID=UPI0039E3D3F7